MFLFSCYFFFFFLCICLKNTMNSQTTFSMCTLYIHTICCIQFVHIAIPNICTLLSVFATQSRELEHIESIDCYIRLSATEFSFSHFGTFEGQTYRESINLTYLTKKFSSKRIYFRTFNIRKTLIHFIRIESQIINNLYTLNNNTKNHIASINAFA